MSRIKLILAVAAVVMAMLAISAVPAMAKDNGGGSPGAHGSPGVHGAFLGVDRDDHGVRGALDTNIAPPVITGLTDPVTTELAEPILTDFVDVDDVGFDRGVDFDRDLHFANGNNHNGGGHTKGHGK